MSTVGNSWDSTVLDTVEVYHSNGLLKEQYQTLFWGGREELYKYGFYSSFYENGQKEWEGMYGGGLGNEKVGAWVRWDSLGYLLTETSYDRGFKNGADIEWNPDGTYRKLVYYKNDTLHGLCTWAKKGVIVNQVFNNPNLSLDSQMYYLNGRILVTLCRSDWPSSVQPTEGPDMPFYNSELDLWHESKNLYGWYNSVNRDVIVSVGRKIEGKKDGMWLQYNRSGNVISAEYYNLGELIETR